MKVVSVKPRFIISDLHFGDGQQRGLEDFDEQIKHHSDYRDVPKEWLGPKFFRDAERLKSKNLKAYKNEYLGLVTGIGGEVFKNVVSVSLTDDDITQFERIRQGLDFGFAVEPSAFIKLCYQKNKNKITLFQEIFEYYLPTKDLSNMVNLKCSIDEVIKADSAEQRTIETMSNEYDVNITACKKGADSVRHGTKWLQDLDIIEIDRKRCPEAYREFTTYHYEKNKQGIWMKKYPDLENHTIDATRYSLDDIILKSGWRVPK